jgi:hypothetical protein
MKQIYNYSKGHVAYQLTTLFKDKDFRALTRLFLELPFSYMKRIYFRLAGKSNYSIMLILLEILGNTVGPFTYIQSVYRVKKLNRGKPQYIIPKREITIMKDAG